MYKVMIVDDDMIVRVGIKMIGSWEEYGMEVVGEASDGRQALALFEDLRPQLIITDIRMPDMDGMDLLKKIRETDKKARILMLTNYDDKEYLKNAIRFGANDFIMKNELDEVSFQKVLERELGELHGIYRDSRQAGEYSDEVFRKKQFISSMMGSEEQRESVGREFEKIFLKGRSRCFEAGILYITYKKATDRGKDSGIRQLAHLSEIVTGVLTAYPNSIVLEDIGFSLTVFIFDDSEHLPKDRWEELCRSIRDALLLYATEVFHIGASKITDKTEEIHLLRYQAEQAMLEASFFKDSCLVLFEESVGRGMESCLCKRQVGMLKKICMSGKQQVEEVSKVSRILLEEIRDTGNRKLKKMFCNEFAAWYNRVMGMMDLQDSRTARECLDTRLLLNAFDDQELEHYVKIYTDRIREMQGEDASTGNEQIDQALNYIEQNYASPISLGDVAAHIHLSKNYFSSLFSEALGESFVDYLAYHRIRKAADILCVTDYQIQEVSELVGFSSERYFSQTFKSIMGISPSEYRNLIRTETDGCDY